MPLVVVRPYCQPLESFLLHIMLALSNTGRGWKSQGGRGKVGSLALLPSQRTFWPRRFHAAGRPSFRRGGGVRSSSLIEPTGGGGESEEEKQGGDEEAS